jgi:hypothetical protein
MSDSQNNSSELPAKLQHAMQLIAALCDERITPEQTAELESLVCNDKEIRKFYVQIMQMHAGLYVFAAAMSEMPIVPAAMDVETGDAEPGDAERADAEQADGESSSGLNETMILPAVREPLRFDDAEEYYPPAPSRPLQPPVDPARRQNLIKGGIAALITLTLGLLAYFVPYSMNRPAGDFSSPIPKPTWYVATVELSNNPVWDPSGQPHDDQFAAGESLVLKSGVVRLSLRHNSDLIVEGPADIRFVSDIELSVNAGRIVATCPGGGMIVRCPTATVTDLGTQFGVSVTPGGATDVEVFKGKVSAALSSTATTQPAAPMLLTVGQAAVISGKSLTKSPEGAIPQRFICSLENQQVDSLDLVDLIGGGDGTTRRRGIGIDQSTGEIGQLTPIGVHSGDHQYHPVKGYPVVDGVFVPDGSQGPMVIDSAGHQFKFPNTTNSTINQIWTGGPIPWPDELGISTAINGEDYAVMPHGILCTHCDNGLTIDLDAVRRLYPDRSLTRFHANFANSYINGLKGASKLNPIASVYVLLDGVSRYQKERFTNQQATFVVDLPIAKTDRFLTLAAVDDGKEIDRDWILWGDPRLDMTTATH